MEIATTDTLTNAINEETHSWNRPRSDEELRSFVESRHSLLDEVVL